MKKLSKKRKSNFTTIKLYANCSCRCGGCGSVPANDYNNVRNSSLVHGYENVRLYG